MGTLFETGIRPKIDEHIQKLSEEVRSYGSYWSASSAGYCMRKNIFERLKVPHTTPDVDKARKQRIFSSGDIFHSWVQGITKESGLSIAQELELQDEDLMIRGHIDDLVLVEREVGNEVFSDGKTFVEKNTFVDAQPHLILYDYKTRNSKNFNYSKQPSYFHKMQTGTYMYMLRKQDPALASNPNWQRSKLEAIGGLEEARVLNISKDDLRMSEVQYLYTDELEKEIVDYWTKLNKYWADKKIPPCTCHKNNGGFMASEKYNPYFYKGKPCSIEWYEEQKSEHKAES